MAKSDLTGASSVLDHPAPAMSAADVLAHAAASYVRPAAEHERPKTPPPSSRPRTPHPHTTPVPAVTR